MSQGRSIVEEHLTSGPTWQTQDGTIVYVHAMSDAHLRNAVRLCERRLSDKRREVAARLASMLGIDPRTAYDMARKTVNLVGAARDTYRALLDEEEARLIRDCSSKTDFSY